MHKNIYFIRHGQAQHNVDEIIYGDDAYFFTRNKFSSLTEIGRDQASNIHCPGIDYVICSSLPRALETADLVFKSKNIPIHAYDEVRESNYKHPCNERRTRSEIFQLYPHINTNSLLCEEDLWLPEGNVNHRNFLLDDIIASCPYDRIAIVSHREFMLDYLDSKGINVNLNNCEVYHYEWKPLLQVG